MQISELIIFSLAVWRISSLFVNETGPLDIFVRIRKLSGIEHDEEGIPYLIPHNLFAGILSCVWCCSIWISIFWTVFWFFSPNLSMICAVPFTLSALAILLNKFINNEHKVN